MAKKAVRLTHPDWVPVRTNKKRQYQNIHTGEVRGVGYYQRKIAIREEYDRPPPKRKTQKKVIQPAQPQPIAEGVSGTKYVGKIEVAPVNRLERYNKMVDGYRQNANDYYRALGQPDMSRRQVMQDTEFKMLYAAYKDSKDRQKGGLRHQALIAFGILDEDDEYY